MSGVNEIIPCSGQAYKPRKKIVLVASITVI